MSDFDHPLSDDQWKEVWDKIKEGLGNEKPNEPKKPKDS
jgi:hypothetical protein